MEQMVLSPFLIAGRVTQVIGAELAQLHLPPNVSGAYAVKQASLFLFQDYVSGLFYLGIRYASCTGHDSARTGTDALVLNLSIIMPLALGEKHGHRYHLDGTVLALFHWQPYMEPTRCCIL